ncbi:GNAT family N-acetyltransferase [Marivivens donghaensis]|uniref:L-ornithine N(alpha)-acyltransferase n=1 Tax=Marivivens donghaensis TaxID=1699413 RepID=A0ABX0VZN3_9RHOB|nr:GNAT family N-acyltransferase [Marivivens donghaensis]NIY72895.1 GNAT family N-acetyltransferase [Marivivens donghaensis]
MSATPDSLIVRLASTPDEVRAAQRLRYRVFVEELGGDGPLVDHDAKIEADAFDPFFQHLLLIDTAKDEVVGVYRLLTCEAAKAAGGFYSESEFDLTALKASGRKLLELGRSCLAPKYRGGTGMFHLWTALAEFVAQNEIDILFGVASFHGTDIDQLAPSLSLLHARHLAPVEISATAKPYQPMNLLDVAGIDRVAAMKQVPALIKGYLKIGGFVGDGAYIDHQFNTTDVCLILDTERLNPAQAALYRKDRNA